MAGHSHAKNVMHRKEKQGAKRAKQFTKIAREIYTAVKLTGNSDPSSNPRLRQGIEAARDLNMPKDRIESAISRATNAGTGEDYQEVRYEGYGPNGSAVIVEALTDNKNRTASDVRSAFSKSGGALGETGSVSFMFTKIGQIVYSKDRMEDDVILDQAINAGASDCFSNEECHEITTEIEDFISVKNKLEHIFGSPVFSGIIWKANDEIEVDKEIAEKVEKLIDALEDSDDVQNVYTNVNL